ncbi:MAG: hypothetical protein PHP45_08040 [Elusimicrobiales bacterium]|nr:hypothetical protein [Elusimicrobiales bacterium]
MNCDKTDLAIKAMMKALPEHAPSAVFNAKVLMALGFSPKPSPLQRWLTAAAETAAVITAGALALAAFAASALIAANMHGLLHFVFAPRAALPQIKLCLLKLWLASLQIPAALGALKSLALLLPDSFLPQLAVSTVLAGFVILAVSKNTHGLSGGRI